MILRADEHYDVVRDRGGIGSVIHLKCLFCPWQVNVKALHKAGDKSGAGRYCRARSRMVKHWHEQHR